MSYECSGHIKDFLHELPKCEHHLHLEGTLEPNLLFKLAERNNITLPEFFPKSIEDCNERYQKFSDLQDFLDHYYVGMSVLKNEDDFYDLAMDYFERAHSENCLHSEVFFDPQGHTDREVPMDSVVNGFSRACVDASQKFGTSNKLIMCLLRHLPSDHGLETIKLAEPFYQKGVIHGLGLDSAEVPNVPENFTQCYDFLRSSFPHIGFTAHAGEEGDHSYVTKSLDHLNVTRIDHGINSHQDDQLMHRLSQQKVMLSLCPLSNLKLQVVDDIAKLPVKTFFEKGIPFSINSDDPAYFGGYILENYIQVHKHFGFSLMDWKSIAINGINGSWCDDNRKQQLIDKVHAVVDKYNGLI